MRALALAAVLLTSCTAIEAFRCVSEDDCVNAGMIGTCEPNSLCSFFDGNCASGKSYGPASGALTGMCVGEAAEDPPDAPPVSPGADASPPLPPGANDLPAGAIDITPGGGFSFDLAGKAENAASTCGAGPDIFYSLTLPAEEVVYLDAPGAIISVKQGNCDNSDAGMCALGNCGTRTSFAASLAAGNWCVMLKGTSSGTLQVVRGGRSGVRLSVGAAGALAANAGNNTAAPDLTTPTMCEVDQPGAREVAFFTTLCDGARTLRATTCDPGTTNYATAIYGRLGRATTPATDLFCAQPQFGGGGGGGGGNQRNGCADFQGAVTGPGLLWVVVDGDDPDDLGQFTMQASLQ